MMKSLTRILAGVGIALGLIIIVPFAFRVVRAALPTRTVFYPLPHQIPRYPGGVSFRFAMVHDIIHDRYPRHGKAYYQERNRRVLATIAKHKGADGLPPPDQFDLIDDLGVGLDSLGDSDEAVRWLRLKLKTQEKLGLEGKALYTSYANLGTFIIHGAMPKAIKGDKNAQERVREGLRFIHQSIAVNPEAHFGREIWQAALAEFMFRAAEDRTVLLKYDFLGNDLEQKYSVKTPQAVRDMDKRSVARRVEAYLKKPGDPSVAADLRGHIALIGAERNWAKDVSTSHKEPVAFDQPCLGIIGLWRLGGGANPHFALALAETMTRIHQRQLAWAAYQRAIREADRFCPEEHIRTKLVERCKGMQEALQTFMWNEELTGLGERFDSELRIGQEYQRAYQKYEEEQIAAGRDLDDPNFYDDFHGLNGNIATPVGDADFLAVQEVTTEAISWLVFVVGTVVFLVALILLIWIRPRKPHATPAEYSR
jgi:hypothetical protein